MFVPAIFIFLMNQKNILITGGTSGLGFELAKLFCKASYNVWITGRSLKAGLPGGMKLHFLRTDFADLRQTENVVKQLLGEGISFDVIVNNAGVLGPPSYTTTKDGFEYTFQINFLAHLLVNNLILSEHVPGKPVTLAIVTSPVYRVVNPDFRIPDGSKYFSYEMYSLTKHYLLLAGDYMKKKYKNQNIRLIKFNPGVFGSGIYRTKQNWFQFLYRIAAPFMRSASRPAGNLYELIHEPNLLENIVYRSKRKAGPASPVLTVEAEKFLLACEEAIKIVR